MPPTLKTDTSKNGATRYLRIEEPFRFASGGQIPRVDVAYETWGELNAERSNALLILTGLSPDAHAASSEDNPVEGWWEPMIGPGKPIDTRRQFVICVNSLGSCKGSTGPASVNPKTGQQYRLSFPDLRIQDIAAAAKRVLDALGVIQLRALVGPSMGGMSCLALLQLQPGIARHFLAISTAARAEPFAIAIRSLQREMIVRDPHWQDGAYTNEDWPETGMRLARKLGMISACSACISRSSRISKRPRASSSATSTPAVTCTSRGPWTGSTSARASRTGPPPLRCRGSSRSRSSASTPISCGRRTSRKRSPSCSP
ncbi:MAG: alpha/beta fold hydrolase, partial [Xanthomonadales bacterium]|nr:alpha/beta fold hydrolase [Xanthomonadales bacterium]